jgi:thioester reductase-like protein
MRYFVTGATGFIGRHLVSELLKREGEIYVLVREGSRARLEELLSSWEGGGERIVPVIGDLTAPALGVSDADRERLKGVEHFFHLAAIYDMSADEESNNRANVDGTRHAVELANELGAGVFHHTSSIAVSGRYRGLFREDMFDEGQKLAERSSSPRSWCATRPPCRGASTGLRSWWAIRRPARWTRSTGRTTSSR